MHAQEIHSEVHFSKVKILIPEKNNAFNIEEHEQSLICLYIESLNLNNIFDFSSGRLIDTRQCNTNFNLITIM